MVMIPAKAARLPIRIVVVLVLARLDDVLGPTIPGNTAEGAVQVNSALHVVLIDEADNALPALLLDEGWSRGDAVVPHEVGETEVGEDLRFEGLDLDFIVVNGLAAECVGGRAAI